MGERQSAASLEKRRFQAFALYRKGLTQAEIARRLRVSRAAVCQWLKKARKKGEQALQRTPRPGRPPKLTALQQRSLVQLLARGPERAGYTTQLWTAERIQRVVVERFGVRYHVHHVPKLLRQCGWSYQRPTGRAIERDEAAIERWIEEDWPRIKKKPTGRKPR
jgi:transposase